MPLGPRDTRDTVTKPNSLTGFLSLVVLGDTPVTTNCSTRKEPREGPPWRKGLP
jgi:hypothetical protein